MAFVGDPPTPKTSKRSEAMSFHLVAPLYLAKFCRISEW